MPSERNAFKLGLAMIVFFVLAIGVLVFLAPRGSGDMKVQVRFPHDQFTTILKPGCEVICGGQTVGSIKALELREMRNENSGYNELYAIITMSVESSLGLRTDCKIVPEGLLLGGPGKLVILDRGVGERLKPEQVIDGQIAADFAALTRMMATQLDPKDPASLMGILRGQLNAQDPKSLLGKMHVSLEDLNVVTGSIRVEFDPKQKEVLFSKLHAILDHVNEATGLLRGEMDRGNDVAMMGKLHQMLDALNHGMQTVVALLDENKQPLTETIGHIRSTTEILEKQIAARIAQQLDPNEAAGLIAKVHVAIDRLGESLKDINAITAAGRETIVVNKEQLIRMIVNMKETSDHLKAASKDIRRNPWRLFYQPTIQEAAQANVFDAARSFSDAATKLDDALIRMQSFSETSNLATTKDTQLETIRDELQQAFTQFNKVENALWQELKIK